MRIRVYMYILLLPTRITLAIAFIFCNGPTTAIFYLAILFTTESASVFKTLLQALNEEDIYNGGTIHFFYFVEKRKKIESWTRSS